MNWSEAEVKAAMARMGTSHPRSPQAPPKPTLPSLQMRYPEEAAMVRLWQAAEAEGWMPDMHFFPTARYRALWCEFIRGAEVLRVLVHQRDKPLTRDQQHWLDTLRQTGKFEVYACEVEHLDPILQRFTEEETP